MSVTAEDMREDTMPGLRVTWSSIYRPEWDAAPAAYVAAGLVSWGRSRRLAKVADPTRGFTAYLGVQHFDPGRWHLPGAPSARFFASFLVVGRSADLRTFAALGEALDAVRAFHAGLDTLDLAGKACEA